MKYRRLLTEERYIMERYSAKLGAFSRNPSVRNTAIIGQAACAGPRGPARTWLFRASPSVFRNPPHGKSVETPVGYDRKCDRNHTWGSGKRKNLRLRRPESGLLYRFSVKTDRRFDRIDRFASAHTAA
jgi:hypothetical protein